MKYKKKSKKINQLNQKLINLTLTKTKKSNHKTNTIKI